MEPSAPTGTGPASGDAALSKNALPRLFVAHGPVKFWYMNTGRSGTASSSSCSVGRRRSANMFGCQPPIEVMNWPGGTSGRRAASVACTSAIEVQFSVGVW